MSRLYLIHREKKYYEEARKARKVDIPALYL
jgi:hypothetical protein